MLLSHCSGNWGELNNVTEPSWKSYGTFTTNTFYSRHNVPVHPHFFRQDCYSLCVFLVPLATKRREENLMWIKYLQQCEIVMGKKGMAIVAVLQMILSTQLGLSSLKCEILEGVGMSQDLVCETVYSELLVCYYLLPMLFLLCNTVLLPFTCLLLGLSAKSTIHSNLLAVLSRKSGISEEQDSNTAQLIGCGHAGGNTGTTPDFSYYYYSFLRSQVSRSHDCKDSKPTKRAC